MRFEELDTESEGEGEHDAGVQLSDHLHFTGTDLGAARPRRVYEDRAEAAGDQDAAPAAAAAASHAQDLQLAMRDKEEVLVQRAMERIRRAQALGQANVKLPVQERDALERKIQSDRARGRKPLLALGGGKKRASPEARRTSSSKSSLALAKTSKNKSSQSSLGRAEDGPANAPGMVYHKPDGQPVFAPIGYYPPGSSSSAARGQQPRMLPDDPNWRPRPRSTSSAAGPYGYPPAADMHGYPYPPPPPHLAQYMHGPPPPQQPPPSGSRRNITYPEYQGARPSHPGASSSDPALRRPRRGPPSSDSEGEDSSQASSGSGQSSGSEDTEGVVLDVVPVNSRREYKVVPAPRSGPGGSSSGAAKKGKKRR